MQSVVAAIVLPKLLSGVLQGQGALHHHL
jgi:hypothetical protein